MSDSQRIPLPKSVLHQSKDVYIVHDNGYVYEFCPHHIYANKWGYVPQHRLVVERQLGYYLPRGAQVHHKDLNKSNNSPENLQVLSRSEHMAIHRSMEREQRYPPLTREIVARELAKGGLKSAARALGCSTDTIRNNFPELVSPYKRKSPSKLDDPEWVQRLRELAADDSIGYREAARELGMSVESVAHILARNNIPWVRKSKAGEAHTKYVRKGQSYADDPALVETIRRLASDPDYSYDLASRECGLSTAQISRIVTRNNIHWTPKSNRSYPVADE